MKLLRVKTPDHPALSFLQPLYETAFPWQERRAWQQLLQLLCEPGMHLCVVMEEAQEVGLVIWWELDNYRYVEYLALNAAQRGRQYGSKVMRWLDELPGKTLVLEVEPPHTEDAARRIRFYERQGFVVWPFTYRQPPYRPGGEGPEMLLMSPLPVQDHFVFEELTGLIRQQVYTRFYNWPG